jgi:Fur family ferric uptake transcriptional regulator
MIIIRHNIALAVKSDSSLQKSTTSPLPPSPRLTPNQRVVLEVLHQHPDSPSAQELYSLLRNQQPIGLATVYRALEVLKLRGMIQRRISTHGESRYSPAEQDQHYLTCLHCRQSFALDDCPVQEPVQELEAHLRSSMPFKIYYHTLEFFGLCEPCADQMEV